MCEDDPYERCFDRLMEAMYHKHSARVSVAGTVRSVKQITADMLNKCYRAFYNPSNMALVVCGNISPEKVAEIADRVIPDSFRSVGVTRFYEDEPPYVRQEITQQRMSVSKPIFSIGIKDPERIADSSDRIYHHAAMSILYDVIFAKSGDLYNEMFESGMISPDFSCSYSSTETFSFATVSGDADDPMQVYAYIKKYISELIKKGIAEEDIERSRGVLYSEFIRDFDSTEEIANNMIDFIMDGVDLLDYGDVLKSVSCDRVNSLLRCAFDEKYFSISVIWPQRKEKV